MKTSNTSKEYIRNRKKLVRLHYSKKLLCTEGHYQEKRQPTEWEKIFTTQISDKDLVFRIYFNLLQLINKKANNSIKK